MIAIIDFGMGNLGSIQNMLKHIGADSAITRDRERIAKADKLILPGVGAFDKAMERLEQFGLLALLHDRVINGKRPVLGICLGMQLMTQRSEEGSREGLGWFDAKTVRFSFNGNAPSLKIPHMGWNQIQKRLEHPILYEMNDDLRFYFVHSYHVCCRDDSQVLATAQHGISFSAAIHRDNIFGVQFHPEKSHRFGMKILQNFAERC